MNSESQMLLDFGVATRPMEGQTASGDLHFVQEYEDGALIAVVDGVGHGSDASAAARIAAETIEKELHSPLIAIVHRCHEALVRTRGAVMTLARVNARDHRLSWLGVGNVEAHLVRGDSPVSHPSESVLLRGGLVGLQLPTLKVTVVSLAPNDLLLFATDGVRAGFAEGINRALSPQEIAERILSKHSRGGDDALVLVARYLGNSHEPARP